MQSCGSQETSESLKATKGFLKPGMFIETQNKLSTGGTSGVLLLFRGVDALQRSRQEHKGNTERGEKNPRVTAKDPETTNFEKNTEQD